MTLEDSAQALDLSLVASNDTGVGLLAVGALVEGEEPDQLALVGSEAGHLPGEPLVNGGAFLDGLTAQASGGVILSGVSQD